MSDTSTSPDAGQARAEKSRHDVYVRVQNILRAGLRTEQITDDVALDWEPRPDGTERLAGVEVLDVRGVEVDGLDIATGRVHGTAPDTGQARGGWADLPTPEDVAAEWSRSMPGSDTAARRSSLIIPACRALDAIGTLREKGIARQLPPPPPAVPAQAPDVAPLELIAFAARRMKNVWDSTAQAQLWGNVPDVAVALSNLAAAVQAAEGKTSLAQGQAVAMLIRGLLGGDTTPDGAS